MLSLTARNNVVYSCPTKSVNLLEKGYLMDCMVTSNAQSFIDFSKMLLFGEVVIHVRALAAEQMVSSNGLRHTSISHVK